ncbi:MAG: flagellar biosynthesis protein [Burkholderiales bacterium RIFCSPHIGHO2_12_FULL_61_11]|nr:MAG: flagellar biosynthesis protein [Burkholderiales bacterium RIFCSPHIGHO2_12_FULL_61_11]
MLNHLTLEHAAIGAFIDLLDREAEAMTRGDFTALPELARRKSRQADEISVLRHQRETEQLALGYAADRSGAADAAAAGGKALQNAWRELQACSAQARERNHRNGVMIHTHLDFTRQSICFLQASGQPLYGPDGTHHAGIGLGNTLGLG